MKQPGAAAPTRPLDRAGWRARHAALTGALVVHVPVLVAVVVTATPGADPFAAALPPAAAVAAAVLARNRQVRAGVVAGGLMWCSGVFVVATGGATPAHLHAVAVVLAVSLYEDWVPLVLAAATGILGYGLAAVIAPAAAFGAHGAEAAVLLGLLAMLLVAACALVGCSRWRPPHRSVSATLAGRERAAADQLASAEAVKDQLVAVVSHEFRTPLASIAGLARTLSARDDELDRETVQACLAGIDHHAQRLTRLVHNVVVAAGEVDVDRAAVTDLNALAREVAHEALAAHDHRVYVRIALTGPCEAAIGRLAARRILGNLCDNAVKFAPCGSLVEVAGACEPDTVVVRVANAAPPSAEQLLEHCFEPFVQADSSDSRVGEGLGLGLYVARQLTRAYGGELDGRVIGERIEFRLRLPRPRPAEVRLIDGPGDVVLADAEPG